MRKVLITLLVLFLFVSCTEDPSYSEGVSTVLRIKIENSVEKNIEPESSLTEIESYKISGSGPLKSSFSKTVDAENNSIVTITDLSVGEWVISVDALNSNNLVLASGSATETLDEGSNNLTVTLSQLSTKGSLKLNYTVDSEIEGQTVKSVLLQNSSTVYEETSNVVSGKASFNKTDLLPGFYQLNVNIFDSNNNSVGGSTEVVYIAPGIETKGDLIIYLKSISSIVLSISYSSPKEVNFTFKWNKPNLSLNFTDGYKDTYNISWYENGEKLSETSSSLNVDVTGGRVHYDVIIYNTEDGSLTGKGITLVF